MSDTWLQTTVKIFTSKFMVVLIIVRRELLGIIPKPQKSGYYSNLTKANERYDVIRINQLPGWKRVVEGWCADF